MNGADQKILPLSRKISYSFGQIGVNIPTYLLIYIWAIYAPIGGTVLLKRELIGAAFAIGVLVQAISNPFVGQISDKLVWKLGRRRPFLLMGTVPLVLSYALLFRPISTLQTANFIYLLIDFAIFNFFYTFVVLPYLAMIPEISLTSQDRVKLLSVSAYFTIASVIILLTLVGILVGKGYSLFAIVSLISAIMAVSFLIPLLTIKEKFQQFSPKSFNLKDAFIATARNKTFMIYMASYVFLIFGIYSFIGALTYYAGAVVLPGSSTTAYEAFASYMLAIVFIFVAIFSPLTMFVSKRYGKKKAMVFFSLMLAIGLFILPVIPPNSILELIPVLAIVGMGATSPLILTYAVLADIIDEDEVNTGFRREGFYFGMQGLIERIPYSLSGFFIGVYVTLFAANLNFGMKLLPVISALSAIVMVIIFTRVPLKEGLKE
ncbi:MAG: MFS transporter [Candidatus Thermoplasmatota archaeon]|nr:MFS transporter [Candidatus Thermoplasmatota archaeon]MCL5681273.1 MFS transporter [Candidatus Thermoplasmatota archaeon]